MRKVFIAVALFSVAVLQAQAQEKRETNEKQEKQDTIALDEVVVKASRVVRRVDGQTIFPSEAQKKNSYSGYSLLRKLTLPGIRVDEMSRTIQSSTNRGAVQVRVNGIIATSKDLQAIDVSSITSVDFIDNPGVRYGSDIAYVVNIHTRRTIGYALGAQAMNTLTSVTGFNNAYASVNGEKSQLRVFYEQGYRNTTGALTNETANYLLADGSTYTIGRKMLDSRGRSYDNSIELKYNLADSATYVFQTTLSATFNNSPRTFAHRLISESGKADYVATESDKSRTASPVLDIYYCRQLGKHQSITANAIGTYIHTLNHSFYDEGSPYSYDVDGKTYSLIGEAIYENRLGPFTISTGLNVNWKYMDNAYSGDVGSVNGIHRLGTYAYAQIKGSLGRLGYMAGVGVSNERYSQGGGNNNKSDNNNSYNFSYWLWRPKAQLSYPLPGGMSIMYSIELAQHISDIAMISDTRIRQNSMEWKVGNPELKPNSRLEQNFTLAYARPRLYTQLSAMYRVNSNCDMGKYTRTDDGQYLYTMANQPHCNMLYLDLYTRLDLIPDHLALTIDGSMGRFFNRGDDYNHCYTAYGLMGDLTGYWGRWTMQLSADNGWRFMEGEMKGLSGGTMNLGAGYRLGNVNITAYWVNPFQRNPLRNRSVIVNRYVGKTTSQYSTDAGNAVQLSVAWRLNRGKKYRDVERKLNNKDKVTGIM